MRTDVSRSPWRSKAMHPRICNAKACRSRWGSTLLIPDFHGSSRIPAAAPGRGRMRFVWPRRPKIWRRIGPMSGTAAGLIPISPSMFPTAAPPLNLAAATTGRCGFGTRRGKLRPTARPVGGRWDCFLPTTGKRNGSPATCRCCAEIMNRRRNGYGPPMTTR